MTEQPQRTETVTVYSYRYFDLVSHGMQTSTHKATRAAIKLMRHTELLVATAEEVPADALDSHGRFRRVATGWGELA